MAPIVILSHAPAGQVETRNYRAFVAPALLPVLVPSTGMPKHGKSARATRSSKRVQNDKGTSVVASQK